MKLLKFAVVMLAVFIAVSGMARPAVSEEEGPLNATADAKEKKDSDVKDVPATADSKAMEIVGEVMLVGTSNFNELVIKSAEKGDTTPLTGELVSELKQLQGLKLKVSGVAAKTESRRDGLKVTAYEILATSDGRVPYVGKVLVKENAVYFMVGEKEYKLEGMNLTLEKFRQAADAKAWIVGDLNGDVLKIRKFKIFE